MQDEENLQIWINGEIRSAGDFHISPFDSGLTTGDGLFETLKGLGGEPFAMRRHHERLVKGAKIFGLEIPEESFFAERFRELMKINDLPEARLRLTVTAGSEARHDNDQSILLTANPLPTFPPEAAVVTAPFVRNDRSILTGLKSTSYAENVLARRFAKEHDAIEAIFGNTRGNLCEGSSTNIFVKYDGKLMTPPLSAGPLPGITRSLVIMLCEEIGLEVLEKDTPLEQLESAEEAFLTSTLRDVMPIGSVNGHPLPTSQDNLTEQVRVAFQELVQRDLNP